MFRQITRKATNALLASLALLAAAVVSCTPQLTDTGEFSLYYPGITDIGPSTNMDLTPSWHGGTPDSFEIYNVTLEGEKVTPECFSIDGATGVFQIRKSDGLAVGKYMISIACNVSGKRFEFPDAITVNMMRAIPEGISVTPDKMLLLLSQVTATGSDEALPTAQITTEGEHISIKNYLIAGVRRDGAAVSDWSELFSVDKTGLFSVLKNSSFLPGIYVIDFKLTTMVVGADSEEGIFANALTVEVAAPPISLTYSPAEVKVESISGNTTAAPSFVGSLTGLEFSIKTTFPETDKVSIDASTGALTLANDHGLNPGEEITVSVVAKNDYGSREFDQVFKFTIVEYIAPITKFEYNDTTVWEGTKVNLLPKAKDGDEVTYSFEELPEALSELSLNERTGAISIAKGNTIAKGDYTFKVKAENAKGSMTAQVKWNTIENPYAFTFVHWGNNLGLTPAENYASQFRVSVTEPQVIPVAKSDIKKGITAKFEIKGGSKSTVATIDAETGTLTTDPVTATTDTKTNKVNIDQMRAQFVFVVVTTGEGTSGQTSMKIPVFFDFNSPRTEGGYSIEYTPFVIQCNPKTGITSEAPTIKKNGVELTPDELGKITMDFRRSFNYWNLNGPAAHKNGAPNAAKDTFLSSVWATYFSSINVAYNSGSRDPMSTYGRPTHIAKTAGYVRQQDRALYIAPEKFVDDNGYANGIFTGQITFSDTGSDPQSAKSPYTLFPLFVWFDTQF